MGCVVGLYCLDELILETRSVGCHRGCETLTKVLKNLFPRSAVASVELTPPFTGPDPGFGCVLFWLNTMKEDHHSESSPSCKFIWATVFAGRIGSVCLLLEQVTCLKEERLRVGSEQEPLSLVLNSNVLSDGMLTTPTPGELPGKACPPRRKGRDGRQWGRSKEVSVEKTFFKTI